MKHYTNYNALMRKALYIAKERGVTEQEQLNAIILEVFSADKNKSAGK